MAADPEVWWRPDGRSPFSLDPSRPRWPQIGAAVGQAIVIFGGPLLGLVTIRHYPFLIENRTLYVGGVASIVFWFLATFLVTIDFPRGTPALARVLFRAGWSLGMTFLVLGLAGIVNGYGMPSISRDAAVVSKRHTRQRDPSRRVYYVAVRAWPNSPTVVELGAPRAVYDALDVPVTPVDTPQPVLDAMPDAGHVRLIIGEGRLGWQWLERIDPP